MGFIIVLGLHQISTLNCFLAVDLYVWSESPHILVTTVDSFSASWVYCCTVGRNAALGDLRGWTARSAPRRAAATRVPACPGVPHPRRRQMAPWVLPSRVHPNLSWVWLTLWILPGLPGLLWPLCPRYGEWYQSEQGTVEKPLNILEHEHYELETTTGKQRLLLITIFTSVKLILMFIKFIY